jgi:hypothetical protein
MPGERSGAEAAVRMAGTRQACIAADCLGSKKGLCIELSDIAHNTGKYRDDRGVSRLETLWGE